MAVRSAFALGLHRDETLTIYLVSDQNLRRHLWRSLYIFDRFLSASMGRPTAISEDDCSSSLWEAQEHSTGSSDAQADIGILALDASVRSCHIIGLVLRRIYRERKVTPRKAQDIAELCSRWPKQLPANFRWHLPSSSSSTQAVAMLHVNLLYCHSVILLTRPFFQFLLSSQLGKREESDRRRRQGRSRPMTRFAEACVTASAHTIRLVQTSFAAGQLPQRNPFVMSVNSPSRPGQGEVADPSFLPTDISCSRPP